MIERLITLDCSNCKLLGSFTTNREATLQLIKELQTLNFFNCPSL